MKEGRPEDWRVQVSPGSVTTRMDHWGQAVTASASHLVQKQWGPL